ncbi:MULTISPECIES: helix-turn-helix domain-containing protein [unclassified Paenibacillus]|uniref:winged helix-turn-helix transcriptional regulator n=1 Tax=unclassified Paenibacillus TaxID=185978 RepID=UPI00104754AF|nr:MULTISPECIES: helix-turn-helix domain-containing protein [unclassified Paenibacillus]NIK67301.1 DNA-binding HxlR family transcriptional regulator [Paenibacillus sp. BK720]TCN01335.1 HxlR family transcriptional regulator [Paenibacillus sp. BK033]
MSKSIYQLDCNIAQTLNIIGDRWTLLVIHEIMTGKKTFNEIKQALKTISANVLSERLKQLEEDGLIASNLYSAHPPRYEYELTESGHDLEMVLNAYLLWGRKHLDKSYKVMKHADCGHEIELRYYCPKCESLVDNISVERIAGSCT